jgi:hypothetical protein
LRINIPNRYMNLKKNILFIYFMKCVQFKISKNATIDYIKASFTQVSRNIPKLDLEQGWKSKCLYTKTPINANPMNRKMQFGEKIEKSFSESKKWRFIENKTIVNDKQGRLKAV